MLPLFIRKNCRVGINIVMRSFATTPTNKILAHKKKMIYQAQSEEALKLDSTDAKLSEEQQQHRQDHFQEMQFQLGKELLSYLTTKTGSSKETINISPILTRHQQRMLNEYPVLNAIELVNYIEVVKNLCLQKMEHIETIETTYSQLLKIVKVGNHKSILQAHMKSLWKQDNNFQLQVRSVCLIQFMSQSTREQYLLKILPHIKHFKSVNMLILIYQKWKYSYVYSYELLDQIHNNQYYMLVNEINQCYLKMLFIKSIKGQFTPNEDGIFNPVLTLFNQKPNVLAHSAFDKFLQIMHIQGSLVQTEVTRHHMERSLNTFINIAKNQNYDHNVMSLEQLVDIYLGFEQTNSTGEILLNEITYLTKLQNFSMTRENFPLYQQLLLSVLNNIQKKLKYQRRDYLNKEYTNDTVNFLREFLPKYIELWPEVIFEVNHAHHELFPQSPKDNPLLSQFQQVFAMILSQKQAELCLDKVDFTLNVLRFLQTSQHKALFAIDQSVYSSLLNQILSLGKKAPSNKELEVLYLVLTLLERRCRSKPFVELIPLINKNIIQVNIQEQNEKEKEDTQIISMDHRIIWLALCSAKIMAYRFPINEAIAEIFVNKELFFMLNSLKYLEVYEILVYTVGLSRLKVEVYEKILDNLSTFIIFISEKRSRDAAGSSFYLNHHYSSIFEPICRLVLRNKALFMKIKEKQMFKMVQIMMLKNIEAFTNEDILTFLDILGDPSYLNTSMNNHIQSIMFTESQLQQIENTSRLRSFEYYNKSLLKYFEGKYNESQIKVMLRRRILSTEAIEDSFSNIEIYKTIIMDGSIDIRFDIPKPNTSIPDFKYMYICQKIFQKIEKENNFHFQNQIDGKDVSLKEVDLSEERQYIQNELPVMKDLDHEFRISSKILPKYIKVEVWKSNLFFDKNYVVDPKDLFHNSKKFADEILIKLIKGVEGKFQKIREVIREFTTNEELVAQLKEAGIQFEQHGAALEFRGKQGGQGTVFTLLCINNTNYKILYICAYYLAKQGIQVSTVSESQSLPSIIRFLKSHFLTAEQDILDSQDQQIEQEDSDQQDH